MAKRIIKETYKYGKVVYRVETNDGLFGLRKKYNWWKTCKYTYDKTTQYAVFNTLENAEKFIEDTSDYTIERITVAIYED